MDVLDTFVPGYFFPLRLPFPSQSQLLLPERIKGDDKDVESMCLVPCSHTQAKSTLSLQRVGLDGTGTNLTVPGYIVNKMQLLRLLYYKVIHSCDSKNENLLFTDIAGSSTK